MKVNKGLDDERILVAGAIGAISTVASEVVSWVILSLGFGKYSVFQLNSLIITGDRPSILIGLIVNIIIGAILGVILYFILNKWGYRYTIIVSIGCSLIMWFLWESVFTISIEGKLVPMRPISGYYKHLIGSFAYGATMGLLLKRFIFSKMQAGTLS